MADEAEEYLAVLKASYDYEPQSGDEIAVKEDQIVFLIEKTDDDWWKVKIKGETQDEDSPSGLVPSAYVEQAEHTSLVKAIYDYDAAAPGELTIKEDDILLVFDREGDWILVQSQQEGGKAGFVPATYVEESTGEEEPQGHSIPQIVVPPSPEPPARPVSTYVDPADRVALAPAKAQADDIKTWAISEVDKKGKKKKGTLGIGNGAVFFASESDKTPVQKWQTSDVENINIEKNKHVHIEVGGPNATKLHFNVGNKDTADAVVAKLESSKGLSTAPARPSEDASRQHIRTPSPPSIHTDMGSPHKKNGASVRFTEDSPVIIPPRESSDDGEEDPEEDPPADADPAGNDEPEEADGEPAVALYDFEGTSADELSVQEGERLIIIEKEGEEWWKCRNEHGVEGVVPASYLESSKLARSTSPSSLSAEPVDDGVAAREEEERLEAERLEEERLARERAEKDRKKKEQEQRAKAAAAAAEADRKRREQEEIAAKAEARRKQRQEAAKLAQAKAEREQSRSPRPESSQIKAPKTSGDSSSGAGRSSTDSVKQIPSPGTTRVWHDRSGQFRVEAALLGYSNGKLRLHKINGVVIEVPSEKMSQEDMRYVQQLSKKSNSSSQSSSQRRVSNDDDDQPLALKRQSEAAKRAAQQSTRKGPQTDWFEFFLGAGCDIDDCTRYASSFERDKIDEAILPDITESTMRSLGLREGDIIRVNKVIQQKYKKNNSTSQEQLLRDEELARQLQEEENGGRKQSTTSPAPNLFAGPGGVLKNNTQRRGRPQPRGSLPPSAVDLDAISTASDQIKRTGSPLVSSPAVMTPVQAPQRSSSAAPTAGGFDDDAWTNRPGSKPPASVPAPPAPAPAAAAPRAPSAPPAPSVAVAPTPPPAAQPQATGSNLAKTDADIFDQLARLSALRTTPAVPSPGPASAPVSAPSPAIASPPPPPVGYNAGLGMGSSPAPLGQHLQSQQTGFLPPPQQSGPRGPFAPVPSNQSLLQPLVPTTTGFNSFVPTRPNNAPSPFQMQPSFLQSQPTGFSGPSQPLLSQPTGFQPSGPLLSQPTGLPGGSFGNFGAQPSFQNTGMPPIQSNPTGFSPFAQSPFNNVVSSPPPAPPLPSYSQPSNHSNTSPANVFAQMKSGTFANGNDGTGPQQPAEKYDALRVNPLAAQPTGFAPQATGWGGYQPNGGYQNGYTGY
ncbi:hypothetical protein BV22DRAFT_1191549 [Leucogyrophana mollusca]|uniref:Uncharacterized protein n=1 Tax=Leucogyrophana mollusca TaxID=85980 RepID=A0ACB8BXU2_9AGAM|nr:hypothetical protein BV22DRAFT_1191549 [Leucogyrophana mollusca]